MPFIRIFIIGLSTLFILQGAEKEIVSIPSLGMGKSFNALVFVPQEYKKSNLYYSTIYLLHGFGGDFALWSKIAPLESYADKYQVIIVCPDGNYSSWYVNSDVKKASNFDSYISRDVLGFIDKNYRTWDKASGRAIIGTSMGGHGATTLLAKHPDLFCGAGSISGIMDLTEFPGHWNMDEIFGDYRKNKLSWTNNSFYKLLENLQQKHIWLILDCGVSDFALPGNRRTHEKLISYGIPHDYYERPGNHTIQYVHDCAEFHFLYFSNKLLKPGVKQS